MTTSPRLSVNLNKVALVRNSRGANRPDLIQVARDCEAFGAEGITVHPRPDQRHVRYDDIAPLKAACTTEFNIEGYPNEAFLALVLANPPHQCTLVPDDPNQLTSDHGWDTIKDADRLKGIIARLKAANIRVSLFVDPDPDMVDGAKEIGADRIELYTGPYAHDYLQDPAAAIAPYAAAARRAQAIGIGINAGHDLDLENLRYFCQGIPGLLEVSIGHALISDALYLGLSKTVQEYLKCLA